MKKSISLLILFLLASIALFAQTWDVTNKSMAQYTTDPIWAVNQGGSAGSSITQQSGYMNFSKTNTGASLRWAWVRPVTAFSEITFGTPYSIEIKARIQKINKTTFPDTATDFEANQIALRMGTKGCATPIFLRYGDAQSGSISTTSKGEKAYTINTSEWQIYRIVLHADHTKYDVYIEGIESPIFENISSGTTSDQNGIYVGAESRHRCNIDVEYAKMGTGDFYSKSKLVSVLLSSNSQVENTEKTITATAKMALINDGEKLLFSLIDADNNPLINAIEAVVTQGNAKANITIPATLSRGNYFVKVAALNDVIDNVKIKPITTEYSICYPNKLPQWAFGGFVRPEGKNPVIEPNVSSIFFCPMNQANVNWEESDTFNPAAVVKDDKICVLYRAEDNSAIGIGKRVSRVALAETTDGVTMTRHSAPIFYPNNDNFSKTYEWPGGCEDPRVAVTEDGLYVIYYTGWDRSKARLCVATSVDLLNWTRYGPIFAQAYSGKYLNTWTKASSIVTELKEDKQVIAKMNVKYNGKNWTYFMYWGEARTYAAVSNDLINWTPLEDVNGNLLALSNTRRGYFDSSLVECGPPAVITNQGILLMYNGRNSTNADADPRFNKGTYSAGQMLFDLNDPCKLIGRTDVPFFRPIESFEKSGQYTSGTVFIEGLVYYKKKWYLYYGCADSKVGVAIYDPANKADGDPIPPYSEGKGIAFYPPHGIGKKIARIHSSSGQAQDSEGAFNLLYSYLSPRKWCENKSQNPWVVFELNDYYNIDKTVIRDVAPFESGNGNIPEYWIYTSITGTAEGDWKEVVHKTEQQKIDIKEDIFYAPEEARYIKVVASRGKRSDNGNAENAIRIYGFDLYGSFSRSIDRAKIISVGKTVLGYYDASDYFHQPLHLFDGDATNLLNRWSFNQAGISDSLKYVILDLESKYEIDKFILYDAGHLGEPSYNISGYNIYVATTPPDLSLITNLEDNNTIWTKVVGTKGRHSNNTKIDIIDPIEARYVKLEIPRSHTYSGVRLHEFEVYKTDALGIEQTQNDKTVIFPNTLRSGDRITVKSYNSGKMSLFNLQGTLLMNKNIIENETTIPIQVPAGTYIAEVTNSTYKKVTKLFVR